MTIWDRGMSGRNESVEDVFSPGGQLRLELLTADAVEGLRNAITLARETRWDSLRSPHVFMGLLASPGDGIQAWGRRLKNVLPHLELRHLLDHFRRSFLLEERDGTAPLALNREFLSDNAIRLLREAYHRAAEHGRGQITSMDLLICILTLDNSIVAECMEGIGGDAATLVDLAVQAEESGPS